MTRKIEFSDGEYYHLYNRGTEKRPIFRHNKDRDRFLASLYVANSDNPIHISNHDALSLQKLLALTRGAPLVELSAYCLMPNHFHLIVREICEGGISKFMQKLITGYTMYFNLINERTGSLFQGRFKAEHIDNDRYLKYLIAYVHLNPVSIIEPKWKENGIGNPVRAQRYLDSYRHSSFLDYAGQERDERHIIDMSSLPDYFKNSMDFKASVLEWLNFKRNT
ncbi:transposase [Candidatus Kaiserbacteria bacterium]|nr:transposase [Candidatus Kaiserbacteria bacterium]